MSSEHPCRAKIYSTLRRAVTGSDAQSATLRVPLMVVELGGEGKNYAEAVVAESCVQPYLAQITNGFG